MNFTNDLHLQVNTRLLNACDEKELFALMAIKAMMANQNYEVFGISVITLVEFLDWSKPTVIKVIRSLVDKGLLKVERQYRDDGGTEKNKYSVTPLVTLV